jgi:tellurite resistance protein TerC
MSPETTWWIAFVVFVLAMLALDLGVFHRHAHEVSMREALGWSGVWITIALVFNLGIYLGWIGAYTAPERPQAALEFLTGYLIEYSLSVDNVFVFALLFRYFHVPAIHQHRVLFWGILGALVMRALLIFAGIALIRNFHWIIYVFGGILIVSGIKMWRSSEVKLEPEKNPVIRLVRRIFPVATGDHGQHFFARENGALAVTPLFIVLVFVEWSDVVFAVDSIPAILAVTADPFIVFTSNVMAMLGLRSLYFAVAQIMQKFHLLHYGLSVLLVFIGTKMIVADWYKIPIGISLAVIATILAGSVLASLCWPKSEPAPETPVA